MIEAIAEKGFATMNVIMSEQERDEIFSAVKGLEEDDLFTRLPASFEAGYLGRGGQAKVALLESLKEGAPPELLASVLPAQDQSYTLFSQLLQRYTQESLGFGIYSRTNLMLRLSFTDITDEARHTPPQPTPKDTDG